MKPPFKTSRIYFYLSMFFSGLLSIVSSNCGTDKTGTHHGDYIDTLKVVTLYGPTSFFNYRGENMGIDYENVRKFAEDEGMILDINVVGNINELISELQNGEAHLAAYPVPIIAEYNKKVLYAGPQEISNQVLVQKKGPKKIKDVTELIGKYVYVEKNSKYHYRLLNLEEEIGGGIHIIPIESDTLTSEDLMEMVNNNRISYSVVDSETSALFDNAYPDLDLSLVISADQASSWAVAPGLDSLVSKINRWENRTHTSQFVKEIYKGYYDRALSNLNDINIAYFKSLDLKNKQPVSKYDAIFKKYAGTAGFDWTLLAAIAYCESRFNPSIASRFGAFGLMQVMPSTAKAVGINPSDLATPDTNVLAASKILARLNKTFENKIEDSEERIKFVIAAYNSGLGHIFDAIALAEKNGMDPQKWTGNVSVAALMKSRPEYYNDPVVKNGFFRGRETVDFVDRVMEIYNILKSNQPL